MASLYGRPPRPQRKTKAKAKRRRGNWWRNERKASMAISARRQLGIGPNEK